MSVDKFGCISSNEIDFDYVSDRIKLMKNGDYDVGKKRLCNVNDASMLSDAVNLKVLQEHTKIIYEFESNLISLNNTIGILNARIDKLESELLHQIESLKNMIHEKTVFVKDFYFNEG